MVTVHLPVSPEVAFDYLVDPVNRPAWQSSLRTVEDVHGEVGLGQSWTDVTVPGLRPAMQTTAFERATRWTETGSWRGVRADLTLHFSAAGSGCRVRVETRFTGDGAWRLAVPVLVASAPLAARADLKAAGKVLAAR